jgi:hypothetical protein
MDSWRQEANALAGEHAQSSPKLSGAADVTQRALDKHILEHAPEITGPRKVFEEHLSRAEQLAADKNAVNKSPAEFKVLVEGVKADPARGIEGKPPISAEQKAELVHKALQNLSEASGVDAPDAKKIADLLARNTNLRENLSLLMGEKDLTKLSRAIEIMDKGLEAYQKASTETAAKTVHPLVKAAGIAADTAALVAAPFTHGLSLGVLARHGPEALTAAIERSERVTPEESKAITEWFTRQGATKAAEEIEDFAKRGRIPKTMPPNVQRLISTAIARPYAAALVSKKKSALDQVTTPTAP